MWWGKNRVDKQLHMKQVVKILRLCTKVQARAETTAETQEAREVWRKGHQDIVTNHTWLHIE